VIGEEDESEIAEIQNSDMDSLNKSSKITTNVLKNLSLEKITELQQLYDLA